MDVRQRTEEIEHLTFAPWATFSDASRGRAVPEPQDPLRPVFQRDRDRVLHCKAFRRLKQKTQVFLSPEGDLYRTRLTHTLEVSQIARTIARALRLNEDLTEAISLAHDLWHTPFGHAGESALDKLCPDGFKHYRQSLRVVDKLEKDGKGLNLTWEVRNGIITHTKGTWAATPEGRIVRMADQIAFVNHDIEDAVRAGVLDPATLPKECTAVLGETKSQRITTMIHSILLHSDGDVAVGSEEEEAFLALKDFMYANVYTDCTAKREEQKVEKVLTELYEYYLTHMFGKKKNSAGAIFVDAGCSPDFSDMHTILYGHHMKNGTMFSSLTGYLQPGYYEQHPTLALFTPQAAYTIRVFAGYVAAPDSDAWRRAFSSQQEFLQWCEAAARRSAFDSGLMPQPGQRVVVKLLEIRRTDRDHIQVAASVKQASANPYEKALRRYSVGNRYVGTVSMVDTTGVFVALDGGVDCLCSYPPRGRPPRGARVTVRILGINHKTNRIWGVITHVSMPH